MIKAKTQNKRKEEKHFMNINEILVPSIIEGFKGALLMMWEIIKSCPWFTVLFILSIFIPNLNKIRKRK